MKAQADTHLELQVSTEQEGKVSVLPYLWTNPESISRSREILSTIETAEGKGGMSPWYGEEQVCPQQASQLR